ncbi:pyrimidine reductase family protein [Streptomyces sp. TRM43335]|uniref:Pyrimidine reductase family protein n=1 Tax=Streptomyces taklimakanensis TaxID=2569853 RepID=A0A6G2BHZ3_9ACTN|nr:pyrimidine reductase family protein [Streptomyces taklimakanensis]MTE21512.1 pyrimidine reductase family protein [Streptomyces taklimakanensis]
MRRLFPQPTPPEVAAPSVSPAGPGEGAAPSVRPGPSGPPWPLEELADAYAYPASAAPDAPGGPTPWLRGNMVSSLDGAAHHGGRSQPLSSDADMRVFGVLRALADAVVVGAETVRQEGYRPARARAAFAARRRAAGQGPAPAIAVVSAGLDLDFSLPLFTEPLVPTLVLTGAAAPADRQAAARAAGAVVVHAGEGTGVDPARVPGLLAEHGHTRLLTEGGPRLLGQFAAAGVLDELCLTLSPRITVGNASRITDGPGLAAPAEYALVSLVEEDGFLFTRYRRAGAVPPG